MKHQSVMFENMLIESFSRHLRCIVHHWVLGVTSDRPLGTFFALWQGLFKQGFFFKLQVKNNKNKKQKSNLFSVCLTKLKTLVFINTLRLVSLLFDRVWPLLPPHKNCRMGYYSMLRSLWALLFFCFVCMCVCARARVCVCVCVCEAANHY